VLTARSAANAGSTLSADDRLTSDASSMAAQSLLATPGPVVRDRPIHYLRELSLPMRKDDRRAPGPRGVVLPKASGESLGQTRGRTAFRPLLWSSLG
jgi:hypothetical protein